MKAQRDSVSRTTHLVFDLETIRDPRVPFDATAVKMKGYQRSTKDKLDDFYPTLHEDFPTATLAHDIELVEARPFPPPPCHEIVCIGALVMEDYLPVALKVVALGDLAIDEPVQEKFQVETFVRFLETAHPSLVSWNGRGFDMPVVQARALKHAVPMPWWYGNKNTRYRYADVHAVGTHIDVKDQLSDLGGSRSYSLEQGARLLGLPGKPEDEAEGGKKTDGSQVEELYRLGKIDVIRRYCLTDVLQTAILFLRFMHLRGSIPSSTLSLALARMRAIARTSPLPPGFEEKIPWLDLGIQTAPAVVVEDVELNS